MSHLIFPSIIVKKTGTLALGAGVNTVGKSIPEKHDQDLYRVCGTSL